MKRIPQTLLLSVLLTGVAYASAPGWYMSIGAGASEVEHMPSATDFGNSSITSGSDPELDQQNLAVRVAVGYFFEGKAWVQPGVELGGSYLGEHDYTTSDDTLDYKFYTVDLLAVVRFTAANHLLLSLKAGLANEYVDLSDTDLSSTYDSDNGYLPEVGASVGYKINDHNALNLSYYRTFGKDIEFNDSGDINQSPSITSGLLEYSYMF